MSGRRVVVKSAVEQVLAFVTGDTGARDPLVPPDFEDPRGATLAEELFGR